MFPVLGAVRDIVCIIRQQDHIMPLDRQRLDNPLEKRLRRLFIVERRIPKFH